MGRITTKSDSAAKTVLAITLAVLVLGALFIGWRHAQSQISGMENYLRAERPDVIAAVEACRREHTRYPDSLTNAISQYYRGKQENLYFLDQYQYENRGTNFYLKEF